jgi:predicted DNA-binding protein with PD1-like motif
MKQTATIAIIILIASLEMNAQAQTGKDMNRYAAVPGGFMMVLRQGDDLFYELEQLAKKENVKSATFTGLGFVNITFGFFDFTSKQYKPRNFEKVELANMTGSLAWKEGSPSIHAHGVVGDSEFQSHAGHILGATVSTGSLEIRISVMPQQFERKKDQQLGADVLNIDIGN